MITSLFAHPLSELDVALADEAKSDHHPVLRLGSPPLTEQLSTLSGPNPQPVLFGLPVKPPQEVAADAAALARYGTIFFVSLVRIPGYGLTPETNEEKEFNASPARFHVAIAPVKYFGVFGIFLVGCT